MDNIQTDPFTSVLQDPDFVEKLTSNPQTCQYIADPGFVAGLEKLQKMANSPDAKSDDFMVRSSVSQKIAAAAHNDPRLMQVLMCGAGVGLTVAESDLKHAEEVGDIKRREPVQLEQLQLVSDLTDPDQARVRGNDYFKKGEFGTAIAHYEKGVQLLKQSEEPAPAATYATLFSNAAMCHLKLKWPDRAKRQASLAIASVRNANDTSFDQSKLFYRRALACEQLKEFPMAVDDMSRALQQAKKSNLSLVEQSRLKGEVDRLKKLKTIDEAYRERKKAETAGEAKAEVKRMQGLSMKDAGDPTPLAGDASYLAERDFSHWATQKIESAVVGIVHEAQSGAKIEITAVKAMSKIEASISIKRGKRALFYELDLHLEWHGKAGPKLKPNDGSGEMDGLIRVYNIGHDTKFQLGGDPNTCYLYQLGWDHRLSGEWFEDLKTEAAELFDLVAVKVDSVINELKEK